MKLEMGGHKRSSTLSEEKFSLRPVKKPKNTAKAPAISYKSAERIVDSSSDTDDIPAPKKYTNTFQDYSATKPKTKPSISPNDSRKSYTGDPQTQRHGNQNSLATKLGKKAVTNVKEDHLEGDDTDGKALTINGKPSSKVVKKGNESKSRAENNTEESDEESDEDDSAVEEEEEDEEEESEDGKEIEGSRSEKLVALSAMEFVNPIGVFG